MVDSHESGPHFEKVPFPNIENKQPLYIMLYKAPHLHLINRQHFFFAFVNLKYFIAYFFKK